MVKNETFEASFIDWRVEPVMTRIEMAWYNKDESADIEKREKRLKVNG